MRRTSCPPLFSLAGIAICQEVSARVLEIPEVEEENLLQASESLEKASKWYHLAESAVSQNECSVQHASDTPEGCDKSHNGDYVDCGQLSPGTLNEAWHFE
jgi:hypothetical protein